MPHLLSSKYSWINQLRRANSIHEALNGELAYKFFFVILCACLVKCFCIICKSYSVSSGKPLALCLFDFLLSDLHKGRNICLFLSIVIQFQNHYRRIKREEWWINEIHKYGAGSFCFIGELLYFSGDSQDKNAYLSNAFNMLC